ncbi:FumA C-terminus/TtdB family hydratase beta subunit [Chloroflexota bacterium]
MKNKESISQEKITEVAASLLARAATKYPSNYLGKIVSAFEVEQKQASKRAIASIIENILYAGEEAHCLCQDTGVPTFHVYLNPGVAIKGDINTALTEATIKATEEVPLRKNVIEPFSYKNSGNNTGWGVPFIHYHYSSQPSPMKIRAELKGFGGEIKSSFDWIMTSSRNMENAVLAYVLNSVILSKGEACLPSFLGIGVGGYAAEAVFNAKNAIFRELSNTCSDKSLEKFEQRLFRCVNGLGLGTMSLGGAVSTLGVYLERRGTHTAVSPVAVTHQCWASRGSEALISGDEVSYITPHLEAAEVPELRNKVSQSLSESRFGGRVYELTTPVSTPDILKLRAGDIVYLNGKICTSRDSAHRRMVENLEKRDNIPQAILSERVIFHCGPVVAQENGNWQVSAAGPTTSSRFTNDGALLVERGIFNVVIGKGTMGRKMLNALKGRGVYLMATGGCAVIYQKSITKTDVEWLNLGYPEAVWIFDVGHFGPLVVGIDSEGNSLTENVMEKVYENAREIYQDEGLNPHERYAQYPLTFAGLSLEEVIEKAKAS